MYKKGDLVEFILEFAGWNGSILKVEDINGEIIICTVVKPTAGLAMQPGERYGVGKEFIALAKQIKLFMAKEPLTYKRAIEILKAKNV